MAPAVYCTGRRPEAAPVGPGPMRAAPLPRARVVVGVGFLWGSPRADGSFGLECLHRSVGVHRPPVTSPWLTRLRVGTCGRPRPVPPWSVSVVGWVTALARPRSRRTADSEGSPGPAAGSGPLGGPNQGRVGGARKSESETRSKRCTLANAFPL